MKRPLGYDVDDNAARFSNYFHVLRELVHFSNGWMPLEPSWERKYALGDHVHDDARALTKIKRRLYELRNPSEYPGSPSPELEQLLDRMRDARSAHEYLDVAYTEAKPALVRAMRVHLDNLDPVADEPSLRLLTQIVERQERHTDGHGAFDSDIGALPVMLRAEPRELRILPPLDEPARDDFVEVTETGDPYLARELYVNGAENHVPTEREEQQHFFHGLMDAELSAAELMARNSHEHPELPWDFHVDMARRCWDEIRHAEVYDRLMATELGCHWGDYPISFADFRSVYALDLAGRLAVGDRGDDGYLRGDALTHAHTAERWATLV
jgi:hypothetical protein